MFDKVLNEPFILSPCMRIRMLAFSFISNTGCSLLISNHQANQSTTNQIDWFLHERGCCFEWVEKWVTFLRNTSSNFCFLVKLVKYLTVSANITCSKSTIKTLGGVKIYSKLTKKTPEQRQ